MFTIDETPVIQVAFFGKLVCPICQSKVREKKRKIVQCDRGDNVL